MRKRKVSVQRLPKPSYGIEDFNNPSEHTTADFLPEYDDLFPEKRSIDPASLQLTQSIPHDDSLENDSQSTQEQYETLRNKLFSRMPMTMNIFFNTWGLHHQDIAIIFPHKTVLPETLLQYFTSDYLIPLLSDNNVIVIFLVKELPIGTLESVLLDFGFKSDNQRNWSPDNFLKVCNAATRNYSATFCEQLPKVKFTEIDVPYHEFVIPEVNYERNRRSPQLIGLRYSCHDNNENHSENSLDSFVAIHAEKSFYKDKIKNLRVIIEKRIIDHPFLQKNKEHIRFAINNEMQILFLYPNKKLPKIDLSNLSSKINVEKSPQENASPDTIGIFLDCVNKKNISSKKNQQPRPPRCIAKKNIRSAKLILSSSSTDEPLTKHPQLDESQRNTIFRRLPLSRRIFPNEWNCYQKNVAIIFAHSLVNQHTLLDYFASDYLAFLNLENNNLLFIYIKKAFPQEFPFKTLESILLGIGFLENNQKHWDEKDIKKTLHLAVRHKRCNFNYYITASIENETIYFYCRLFDGPSTEILLNRIKGSLIRKGLTHFKYLSFEVSDEQKLVYSKINDRDKDKVINKSLYDFLKEMRIQCLDGRPEPLPEETKNTADEKYDEFIVPKINSAIKKKRKKKDDTNKVSLPNSKRSKVQSDAPLLPDFQSPPSMTPSELLGSHSLQQKTLPVTTPSRPGTYPNFFVNSASLAPSPQTSITPQSLTRTKQN